MEASTAGRQSPTGTNAQRITELERQLAELRRGFDATFGVMEFAFQAGHDAGRQSITGRHTPTQRPPHLHLFGGAS
jgi:hypothetical protein